MSRTVLFITARYHTQVTGDLHESIRDMSCGRRVCPRVLSLDESGKCRKHRLGVRISASIRRNRAIAIDVNNAAAYVVLARAQMRSGRMDEALATCQQAIIHKLDGAEIHGCWLEIGFANATGDGQPPSRVA